MDQETLNIDYHISLLVVKALNKSDTIDGASILLGVTSRTVFNYISQYSIVYDKKSSLYVVTDLSITSHGEVLNLSYNNDRLLLKALNTHKKHKEAALALKISEKTLQRIKKERNIVHNPSTGLWYIQKAKKPVKQS